MLNFFKTRNPSAIIFLLVYLIILKLLLFILPVSPDFEVAAPFSELLFKEALGFLKEFKFWYLFLSFFFIFIQALILNQVFMKHQLVKRLNYIPAMTFLLITTAFDSFSLLSPALAANFFLIFATDKLLSVYQEDKAHTEIFDAALFISIASLFYFPAALLFVWLLIGIFILKAFKVKDLLVSLLGLITPYLLIGTYFYWHDILFLQLENHILHAFEESVIKIDFAAEFVLKTAFLSLALIITYVKAAGLYFKSIVQVRKIIVVLSWFLVIAFGSFLLQPYLTLDHFVMISIPLSALLAYYFLHVQHRITAEVVHLILVLLILFFHYAKLFELEISLPL